MPHYTVHYRFSQSFPFPLEDAWRWSTDYDEDDIRRTGLEGKREIERIDRDTLILNDTYFGDARTTKKRRLVRIYPQLHMLTNTRLSSANRHSQFIYQFVGEGKNRSRLDFAGAQVNYSKERPTRSRIAALAREYAEADSKLWVNLAAEMKRDLSARR